MPDTTTPQSQTILTLAVPEDVNKQLKTCFSQEKDEVQTMIKKLAKKHERDFLIEYATYLFVADLEKKYELNRARYVASYKPIIEMMIGQGLEKEAVLGAMQISEEEFEALAQKQPSKGTAKKLADIQRLVASAK